MPLSIPRVATSGPLPPSDEPFDPEEPLESVDPEPDPEFDDPRSPDDDPEFDPESVPEPEPDPDDPLPSDWLSP